MNIEDAKLEILIQYGIVKGVQRTLKKAQALIERDIKRAEEELESAKLDCRYYGHFDDCGDSYQSSKSEAQGALQKAKDSHFTILKLVFELRKESKYLKLLKHKFREAFGEIQLEALNLAIRVQSEKRAKRESEELRQKKSQVKKTMKVLQVLTGNRTEKLIKTIRRKGKKGTVVNVVGEISSLLTVLRELKDKVDNKYALEMRESNLKAIEKASFEFYDEITEVGKKFVTIFSDSLIREIEFEDNDLRKLQNFISIIKVNLV